ncbi:MAG: RNA polymerase sigma factor [Planctomycetota bacterium]
MDLQDRLRTLVEEHYDNVYRYARFCAGGDAEAEDLAQEAFLAAFRRVRKGVPFEGDPGAWLRGVVRNQARARRRRLKALAVEDPEALQPLDAVGDQPLQELVREEAFDALAGCLEKLPAAERDLLGERYNGDAGVEAMAETAGINPKTLRVRLFRIRKKLKTCLESTLGEWCDL